MTAWKLDIRDHGTTLAAVVRALLRTRMTVWTEASAALHTGYGDVSGVVGVTLGNIVTRKQYFVYYSRCALTL